MHTSLQLVRNDRNTSVLIWKLIYTTQNIKEKVHFNYHALQNLLIRSYAYCYICFCRCFLLFYFTHSYIHNVHIYVCVYSFIGTSEKHVWSQDFSLPVSCLFSATVFFFFHRSWWYCDRYLLWGLMSGQWKAREIGCLITNGSFWQMRPTGVSRETKQGRAALVWSLVFIRTSSCQPLLSFSHMKFCPPQTGWMIDT